MVWTTMIFSLGIREDKAHLPEVQDYSGEHLLEQNYRSARKEEGTDEWSCTDNSCELLQNG